MYTTVGGALNWTPSPTTDGQVLIISGGAPAWSNGSFMQYDVSATQNTSLLRTHNLFNVSYNAAAPNANAAGAIITSTGGPVNSNATGLTITSIASGTGIATGLSVMAAGGTTRNAIDASGNINILSSTGVANSLNLQNPAGTFSSSLIAGAQTSAITYTLPVSVPVASSILYSSGGASSSLTWSNTGSNGQVLTINAGVPSWETPVPTGNYVNYDVTASQSTIVDRTHNLFNVAYNGSASDADAAGAAITSVAGPTNGTATGLTITATGTGLGNATGLSVTANGGTVKTAIAATGNVNILSAGGTANTLGLQNPAGTFASYFKAGAQTQDITYTFPTAPPPSNGLVLTANTTGVLSWASAGGTSGWLTNGNAGLVDNTSNYFGTLDNIPVRFVSGSGGPNTRMVLDASGNMLFGTGSGTTTVSSGSGKLAFGDALTTARLNSVPTVGTNVFNMIDATAALRVWRFATNAGNSDPAIDLIGGTNDNQANSANQWWSISSTGTPGNSTSGTNGTGEHMTFRRRSGSTDTEYVSVFAGGNVGIGANASGYIPSPSNKLTVMAADAATTTTTDVLSIGHNSSATPSTSFGTGMVFKGQSSTTTDRNIAKVGAVWTDATDATRMGALTFSTDSIGTDREKVRITGNGYVGVGATDPGIRVDINGGYATRSKTVTLTSASPNNNVPVGDCAFLRIIGPTAPFTITGLAAGVDGQRLRIANITGQDMTIADSSSSSTLGNRIETNTNSDIIVKGPVPILDMTYDGATSQWLLGTLNANQIVGGVGSILYAYKTADESIGNNATGATLQDDDHLKFTVSAGQTWELNGEIDVKCTSTNPDMDFAFTVPTGSTLKVMFTGIQDANGNAIMGNGQITASGVRPSNPSMALDNTKHVLISFRGIIRTGSTGGAIQFQWCQNSGSTTDPVTVYKDSYMKLIRIQ